MVWRRAPSLVDLCVRKAIDNLRYLGDVGETDAGLLQRILPHCTVEQLMHVENSSTGRDLTPITDKLWKGFYQKQFGSDSANLVIERMKQKKVAFRWRQLYEAKLKDVEEAQKKSFDRIKQLYKKEESRKQSRQVQICTKVPPASNKRNWGGMNSCVSNTKSNILKKAKVEFLKSPEVRNAAAMKRSVVQRSYNISASTKPTSSSGQSSASASRPAKPPLRR
ncbi:hypothetical protein MLD38_009209 [Melastoma candidum]|uniref:Uncharacterized protein n=1 Tax=Melastoma candidum TaxID=119954 RepID=A0ACB9RZV5_9MYRT|nr:hypothetical protein MLD38_009209 [Melastoma candidum]